MEDFSISPEAQNEAVQLIEQFLADEEGFQALEAEKRTDVDEKKLGPRRIELVLQEKNAFRLPATRKRIVVTALYEPTGHFRTYLLHGREWRNREKGDLSRIKTSAGSDKVDILEMFIYDNKSIYKEESEQFSTEEPKQETAWKRAWRELNRLSNGEKEQLHQWDGTAGTSPGTTPAVSAWQDPDLDDDYGYGYLTHTPSVYKPSPPHRSYFRVAGDSVGTELLQKQRERMLTATIEVASVPDPTPEAKTPVVPGVGTAESPRGPVRALPIIFKPDDSFNTCYCGMPGCDNCHLTSVLAELGGKKPGHYTVH